NEIEHRSPTINCRQCGPSAPAHEQCYQCYKKLPAIVHSAYYISPIPIPMASVGQWSQIGSIAQRWPFGIGI
ncbi:35166_t:CDS:2, partial [Gigaspora margarita]